MKNPPGSGPPKNLDARFVTLDGERFVLFSWTLAPAPALGALSKAERGVLDGLVGGLTNQEIATRRGTSVRTVANQVASILRKLGVGSRNEAVRIVSGGG